MFCKLQHGLTTDTCSAGSLLSLARIVVPSPL